MVRTFQRYAIAAGYNVALGSLVNIETIQPTNDRYFVVVNCFGSFDPGVLKVRSDQLGYFAGWKSLIWLFGGMTFAQHEYLRTTYCGSVDAYRGKVTILTRTNKFDTYYRYNAVIDIPKDVDLRKRVNAYPNVPIQFVLKGLAS